MCISFLLVWLVSVYISLRSGKNKIIGMRRTSSNCVLCCWLLANGFGYAHVHGCTSERKHEERLHQPTHIHNQCRRSGAKNTTCIFSSLVNINSDEIRQFSNSNTYRHKSNIVVLQRVTRIQFIRVRLASSRSPSLKQRSLFPSNGVIQCTVQSSA